MRNFQLDFQGFSNCSKKKKKKIITHYKQFSNVINNSKWIKIENCTHLAIIGNIRIQWIFKISAIIYLWTTTKLIIPKIILSYYIFFLCNFHERKISKMTSWILNLVGSFEPTKFNLLPETIHNIKDLSTPSTGNCFLTIQT